MTHYTYTLSLSLGGDEPHWEGEADICYAVTWGHPESPPSYSHGGLPADPDEVCDVTVVRIDGTPVVGPGLSDHARQLECLIETNDALIGELLTHAYEIEAERRAEVMEYRRED